MARIYKRRCKVRQYELDSFGHVNNAVYVNYLQEAAIEASADAGYDMAWYQANGTRWVIRKLTVHYHSPAFYGDELEVTTWVSDIRRVRSHREYDVHRLSDGVQILRARADWVYVDVDSGKPVRVPGDAEANFDPTGEVPDLHVRLRNPEQIEGCHRYRSRRRVQNYELDAAQHVNHAHYLRWIEQAYFDAAASVGYSIPRMLETGWIVLQGGHEIEYFLPAQEGDEIEIISWVVEMGTLRGAWTHEVYNARTGQLLARDYSMGIFLDEGFNPRPLPEQALAAILAGPG